MNRLTKTLCLIAVLVPFSTAVKGTAAQAANNAERELLAASAAWDEAFNSGDVDGVMALYADGAVSMPPGFPDLVGKAAIQADYEFLFENFDFQHQTTVVQLEIHGAMAVERGEYTNLVTPADGSPFVETASTSSFEKRSTVPGS
jgi:ketosteroid isomerase-like protein